MCLRLTQQFNAFLSVSSGDDSGAFDGFQRDPHHVPIVPFQRQRIAGDGVVFNDEMNQRLLVVITIAN